MLSCPVARCLQHDLGLPELVHGGDSVVVVGVHSGELLFEGCTVFSQGLGGDLGVEVVAFGGT